jgi:2-polyprenyl-3-methyl-5-hydroxy-6-metoxy-1,4-benzoquinol methylase
MKNGDLHHHPDFFKGKYDHENILTRPIIQNFFHQVGAIIPGEISCVLEVGCGPGHSTECLSAMHPNVLYEASDVDPTLVRYAQERNPSLRITQESAYNLARNDSSFDVVICLEVLEHLDDPERALKEIFRVSKQSVLVSVPNEPIWRILNMMRGKYLRDLGNTPGHINHWSPEQFRVLLSRFGRVTVQKQPLPWTVLLCEKND